MDRYDSIKAEIKGILPNSPLDFELIHAQLALDWVCKMKPDADEALKIAALSHDIERAVTGITEKDLSDYSKINEFKKEHSIRSANIVSDLLMKYEYSKDIIDKVKHLVENHEFGGDAETDILTDADSLAFFSYNIPSYVKRNGSSRAKQKIKFMYDRLSQKAKELVASIEYDDSEIARLVNKIVANNN